MPDAFVTVHRGLDPVEAEIVGDLLGQEGLDARVLGGNSSARLYPSWSAETRVDVRAAQADQARRIIEAYRRDVRPSPADSSEPFEEQAPRPLRHVLAAGVMAVCPGGAHLYARRTIAGAMIAIGEIAAIAVMCFGATSGPRLGSSAALFLCGLLLLDLVGGQLAVRAWNRGVRPTKLRQLAAASLVMLGLGAVAAACGPVLERLYLPQRRGWGPRSTSQEMRMGSGDPRQLPFPLHLDFTR